MFMVEVLLIFYVNNCNIYEANREWLLILRWRCLDGATFQQVRAIDGDRLHSTRHIFGVFEGEILKI
ncbi:MAG: hypothetical protein EA368_09010 [Leptolyngbya sp. DLM2.Bin27]|nr:MAG: hypothetical protein EA368_09010 [Leptolyngbya sp. DLM2.Bin27]